MNKLVKLAKLYGIDPYIKFEDIWPFGDPHDVGKIKPNLQKLIEQKEAEINKVKSE